MADAFEIHGVLAPVGRIDAGFDVAEESGMWPIDWRCGQSMLDRVVVDVVNVAGEIVFVAQQVFPVAMLPQRLLALGRAGMVGLST